MLAGGREASGRCQPVWLMRSNLLCTQVRRFRVRVNVLFQCEATSLLLRLHHCSARKRTEKNQDEVACRCSSALSDWSLHGDLDLTRFYCDLDRDRRAVSESSIGSSREAPMCTAFDRESCT